MLKGVRVEGGGRLVVRGLVQFSENEMILEVLWVHGLLGVELSRKRRTNFFTEQAR
jgi:hypothetical protein